MSRWIRYLIVSAFLSTIIVTAAGVGAQDAATPESVEAPQSLLPETWDEVEGQTVAINGANIYYEVYGEGEPLILLHGGLANGTYYRNQISVFAEQYQVIVMDSRGHGRSSFDDQPITYALMASDVLGLMDHLEIEKADIVGWSDGGIIGLEIALTHPERLNRVVAYGANYDPTGVKADIETSTMFNAYIEAAAADYQIMSPEPERWDEFLNNIGEMWATLPNYTVEQLGTITTPFLILDGVYEEAIDTNHMAMMAEAIPGSEMWLIANTGHFAMFERPDEFNRVVLDYLAA
jgi:pimeloyl-ACP methyl ester carboxylesterase